MIPVPVSLGRLGIRTNTACLIDMAGGALILLEAYLIVSAYVASIIGLLIGALIISFAATARSVGRYRPALGAGTLLLGVLSFLFVSGFYVGALLAIFGGVLIASAPSYAVPRLAPASGPASFDLGPPCPRCGKPVPVWTTRCPYCGHPDPPSA